MGFSPALSHCSHASSQLNPYTDHPIRHFKPCKLRNRRSWSGREGLLRAGGSRAAIAVGEQIPDVSLSFIDKQGNLQTISTSALTRGKKVVLFAVPGAFTPTCTQRHLPGFVQNSYELKRRGVHTIACISVNDVFVLKAWQQSLGVDEDKVLLLSDGNAHFTTAMGAILDLRGNILGLGVRSCRYSLLAEDGVVKLLHLEDGGMFTRSGADDILKHLQTW